MLGEFEKEENIERAGYIFPRTEGPTMKMVNISG